jgi:hypothetical protein
LVIAAGLTPGGVASFLGLRKKHRHFLAVVIKLLRWHPARSPSAGNHICHLANYRLILTSGWKTTTIVELIRGKRCCGRTPIDTMIAGKRVWSQKVNQLNQT